MKSIFVSSTFKDMHEERDILHKRVIPELNEYAAQYGESVSLCDLRWGVNTEDLDSEEGSKKVLSVCLDGIDRCRPYMIVLLGERYGWIPEPETLREVEKTRAGMNLEDLEKSVTALEIEYGALGNKKQLEHTLFYFREFEGIVPEKYGREDTLHERKLSELKKRIRNMAGDRVHAYTVSWDAEKNTLKGLGDFAEQMTADLKELLEEEWKEYALLTPFERDQRLQWDFARQKSDQFRAREGLINQYLNKLNQGKNFLAISGASGSGKSTLIGRLAVRLQEEGKNVLPIFCGSTLLCNDAMDVSRYIVRYIENYYSLEHCEEKKERDNYWIGRLTEMCDLYAEKSDGELVILIDALDRLFPDENMNSFCYKLMDLSRYTLMNPSSKVKIVCSLLDNFKMGYPKQWEHAEQLLPLNETDKKAVIEGILHSHQGKELPLSVIEKIMTKKGSDNPLYLSLEVQRLVMMDRDDYEKMTATGDKVDAITAYEMAVVDELPEDLEELCMDLVHVASEKLENNMAELAVRYIAVSRYGLREEDLKEIFMNQGIEWKTLDFTLFLRYMKSFFLLRDDGRWDFTHSSIRTGILKTVTNKKKLHRQILEYLKKLDKYDEVRISEIIYHCWGADDQRYFVQYISIYEEEKDIIGPASKVSYETAMLDNGNWLSAVINNENRCIANHKFMIFLNYQLYYRFSRISQKERKIYEIIVNKVLGLAEELTEMGESSIIQSDLSISYDRVGDICSIQGGEENLRKAEEMYERSLEIRESLAATEATSKYLQDLSRSYENVGDVCIRQGGEENLKKVREIYEKSLERLEELVDREGKSENRRVLSISYDRVGDICEKQGGEKNLRKAREMYERSLGILEELVGRKKSIENMKDLDISYDKVGNICKKQGGEENLKKAREMYEKSLEIAEELVDIEGIGSAWNLGVSYGRVGDICEKQGGEENLKKAREMYERSLEILEELVNMNWEERYSKGDLVISYDRVGNICVKQGGEENLKKAREMYEKNLEILEELVNTEESNEYIWDLGISYRKVGDICLLQGGEEHLRKALEMYEKSVELLEKLVGTEENSEIVWDLWVSYIKVGNICEKQGREEHLRKAREMYERSLEIAKKLVDREGRSESLRVLSISYDRVGNICKKQGGEKNLKKAREMCEKSLEILEELVDKEGRSESLRGLGVSYMKVGDICLLQEGEKNLKKAREMYEKSVELLEKLVDTEGNSEIVRELCVSYRKVGNICKKQGGEKNLKKAREMYERSLEIAEERMDTEGSSESLRNLGISYNRVGKFWERQGGEDNLKKAREMYEKSLEIVESLAEKEKSISAYDDLTVCLYGVAMHSFTSDDTRKQYIKEMKSIAELLYQKTGNSRYQKFIDIATTILR